MEDFEKYREKLGAESKETVRERLGFNDLLYWNVLNITKLSNLASMSLSTAHFKGVYNSYRNAVITLEALLSPYIDDQYEKEMKPISEYDVQPDSRSLIKTVEYYLNYKFRALMSLMARKNLLLQERMDDVA